MRSLGTRSLNSSVLCPCGHHVTIAMPSLGCLKDSSLGKRRERLHSSYLLGLVWLPCVNPTQCGRDTSREEIWGTTPPQEIDIGMGDGWTHTPLLLGITWKLDLRKEKEASQNIGENVPGTGISTGKGREAGKGVT